jgi:hypothetical protein
MKTFMPSPTLVVALVALFVSLTSSGLAGNSSAHRKTVQVLGPTSVVTKNLPLDEPSGYVECPRGYQALGGGYDSWRPPDYRVGYDGPSFGGNLFRDSGEGLQRPATGWFVGAVRVASPPAGITPFPLKAIVICAKVLTIRT